MTFYAGIKAETELGLGLANVGQADADRRLAGDESCTARVQLCWPMPMLGPMCRFPGTVAGCEPPGLLMAVAKADGPVTLVLPSKRCVG